MRVLQIVAGLYTGGAETMLRKLQGGANRGQLDSACPESAVFSASHELWTNPRVNQGLGHAGCREIT